MAAAVSVAGAGAVPCGLGSRDTLRLEAGLALWGSDIDETTTPLEAGLDFEEPVGEGEPLVIVHGGWTDHTAFDAVVPVLVAVLAPVHGVFAQPSQPEPPAVAKECGDARVVDTPLPNSAMEPASASQRCRT